MADVIVQDYEGGQTLATLGWYSLNNGLANGNTNGLSGSTWGIRSSTHNPQARGRLATTLTGRLFRVEAEFDLADYTEVGFSALKLNSPPLNGNNTFAEIFDDTSGDLHFDLYANGSLIWSSAPSTVPASGVTRTYALCGEMSSASGVPDGSLTFSLDGVVQHTQSGLVLWGNLVSGGQCGEIDIHPKGRFDNLLIADDGCVVAVEPETIPVDESTPCCGSGVTPGTGTGGVGALPPSNPSHALIGFSLACTGGGVVPQAADLTDSESWL